MRHTRCTPPLCTHPLIGSALCGELRARFCLPVRGLDPLFLILLILFFSGVACSVAQRPVHRQFYFMVVEWVEG